MKQTQQKKRKKKPAGKWPWVAAAIALLAIGAAVFAGTRLTSPQGQTATAYLRGGSLYMQREPGGDSILVEQAFASAGEMYVRQTSTGDYLLYPANLQLAADGSVASYDLYAASTRGRSAGEPFLVAQSVSGAYQETPEKNCIVYLRGLQNGLGTLCSYDLNRHRETQIEGNVAAFEQLPTWAALCYLHMEGDTSILLCRTDGETEEIARGVTEFHLYATETAWELFYLGEQQGDVFSLYKKGQNTQAQLVSEGVASALFDQYVPGGPFYYLCPSAKQPSWTDFIEDDQQQADAAMQEPNITDFIGGVLGSLFPTGDYGAEEYHSALTAYTEKLQRDRLREELDAIDLQSILGTLYDCYAFYGTSSLLLGESLQQEELCAASPAAPAIVFRSTARNQDERLQLSTLDEETLAQAEKIGWEAFLTELVEEAQDSPTLIFSAVANGSVDSSVMESYPVEGEFSFSEDGSFLYALDEMDSGGSLSRSTVSEKGLTERTMIDGNVSQYTVSRDTIYYLKGSNAQAGTLYKFTYSESILIENNIRSLEQMPDGNLLFYQRTADGNTTLFLLREGEAQSIGMHVVDGSARYQSPERILFLRNPDASGAGELCWYHGEEKLATIDQSVRQIFF